MSNPNKGQQNQSTWTDKFKNSFSARGALVKAQREKLEADKAAALQAAQPAQIPGWTSYKFYYKTLPPPPKFSALVSANSIAPNPAPLETTESTTPLVGFRAWKLTTQDGKAYLQSTYKTTIWPHRRRLERGEKPPEWLKPTVFDPANVMAEIMDMSKGIHAIKQKHKLGQLCVEYEKARICGEIYMWGEVTETKDGYLAQYAYPKELWVMTDMDPTIIMELEENYGVPVRVSEAIELVYKLSLESRSTNRSYFSYATTTTASAMAQQNAGMSSIGALIGSIPAGSNTATYDPTNKP